MALAITGGTGFVGGRVLSQHSGPTCALARTPQPVRPSVTWVAGDLADPAALTRLCEGAIAVIHIAGIVSAPDRAGFEAGNITGTAAMLAAAPPAPVATDGWISCADRLPRDFLDVLACNFSGYVGRAHRDRGHWSHIGSPTHWQPLPKAPIRAATE